MVFLHSGKPGQAQKPAKAAALDDHFAPAQLTDLIGLFIRHLDAHTVESFLGILHLAVEILIEIAQDGLPADLSGLDLVELVLHIRRELDIDDVAEALDHQLGHDTAERRRQRRLSFLMTYSRSWIVATIDA